MRPCRVRAELSCIAALAVLTTSGFPAAGGETAGAPKLPPTTPIELAGKRVFPVGLYRYPKHRPETDIYRGLAEQGFNLYLLPATATREELDAAQANGIRVMLVVSDLMNLSGSPEQIAKRKQSLAERIGPESVAYKHPAVVALEGPDEPLWNTGYHPGKEGGSHPELATWARPAEEREVVYALLKGLRDGYEEIRRLCGDRYQVWLNFAPRRDEDELRWFTGLPVVGGYSQDGRRTADVFGTDIYPVPDGTGNNGWIRGRLVASPAAVGAFTAKLRRAVHPHPFYMVLHGCGLQEWDAKAVEAGQAKRRPTFEELQFMVFDAIVNGGRGILYWGANYIPDDSEYWSRIGQVNRQLRVLEPVLCEAEDWPDALAGMQEVTVLGKVHQARASSGSAGASPARDEHYVIATCNRTAGTIPGWIAVAGWQGDKAYSLLDGREVPVVDGVIRDTMPPLSVRVYTDGTSLLDAARRVAVSGK